tara:strand:+ start:448 stop:1083 length:636 start_codon:yes stop_codon:yes gene_type:complete
MAFNLIIEKYFKINKVSRETINDIEEYKGILIKNNKKFNLISQNDEKIIDVRHILDSLQVIDLIDKNNKKCIDLGSGAGFPGLIIAIIMKNQSREIETHLYEKSLRKSEFLKLVSDKLKLNTKIISENILNQKNLATGSITARAFKPVDEIFKITLNNFKEYKNLILFLGKNSKQDFLDTTKTWDFEYKERKSITSKDSLIVNVKNIKKKN